MVTHFDIRALHFRASHYFSQYGAMGATGYVQHAVPDRRRCWDRLHNAGPTRTRQIPPRRVLECSYARATFTNKITKQAWCLVSAQRLAIGYACSHRFTEGSRGCQDWRAQRFWRCRLRRAVRRAASVFGCRSTVDIVWKVGSRAGTLLCFTRLLLATRICSGYASKQHHI